MFLEQGSRGLLHAKHSIHEATPPAPAISSSLNKDLAGRTEGPSHPLSFQTERKNQVLKELEHTAKSHKTGMGERREAWTRKHLLNQSSGAGG